MRIAYLIDVFPRLSNTFILNQITGMIDRGHEVDIFARSLADLATIHDDVRRYRLTERLRHVPIPQPHGRRALEGLRLLLERPFHPAAWNALDPREHGRAAWTLAQLFTVGSFLRHPSYDVVHAQFGQLGPALLPLLRSGALGGGLVVSFRGSDTTRVLDREPDRYRELFRRGHLFLPVSRSLRERLLAAGAPAERTCVHHSGIPTRRFPFEPRRLEPGETPRLVFVGRLAEKKGLAYALRALARLQAEDRPATLTVVGDGELRGELELLAVELGLESAVRFLGRQPQERVVPLLREHHLLIAPSVTAADGDQEGIPNVLKEAMACGMPVVATTHSGIPELVEHGVSGVLAPERDAEALARELRGLLDRPERWPEMGRAGRARVEEAFDGDRLNDELEGLYREAARLAGTAVEARPSPPSSSSR